MKKWKSTSNYMGEDMSEYYILYSKTRDSGVLHRANFAAILAELEDSEGYEVHTFGHWACGWIEAIMIHEKSPILGKAENIYSQLQDYAVLDEELYSAMQRAESLEHWESASLQERIELCSEAVISIFAARHDTPCVEVMEYLETEVIK